MQQLKSHETVQTQKIKQSFEDDALSVCQLSSLTKQKEKEGDPLVFGCETGLKVFRVPVSPLEHSTSISVHLLSVFNPLPAANAAKHFPHCCSAGSQLSFCELISTDRAGGASGHWQQLSSA